MFIDTVNHNSFFVEVDEIVMGEICLSAPTLIFLPNNMILFKYNGGTEQLFVAKGVLKVMCDNLPTKKREKSHPILLRSRSFIGEIVLIMEVRQTYSVQANAGIRASKMDGTPTRYLSSLDSPTSSPTHQHRPFVRSTLFGI